MPSYSYTASQLTDAVTQVSHSQIEPGLITTAPAATEPTEPLEHVPSESEAAFPVAPRIRQRYADPSAEDQQRRFLEMIRVLNAGSYFGGVQKWVATFGHLSDSHPFGDQVFQGMAQIWPTYVHRHKVEYYNTVFVGWFLAPRPFAKAQAAKPASTDNQFWRLASLQFPTLFFL